MALDALWAVLIPEVSGVSKVQAPVHAGLRDTPAVLPEVSGVSIVMAATGRARRQSAALIPLIPHRKTRGISGKPHGRWVAPLIPLIPLKKSTSKPMQQMSCFQANYSQPNPPNQSEYSGSAGRG